MKKLIEWNSDLSVGIESMDKEHQQLISYINDLNDAMASGKGSEKVSHIITQLRGYAQTHFKDEENLLRQHNYPGLSEQITAHTGFVSKVKEFEASAPTSGVAISVLFFLKDWLLNHIRGVDKKYGPYLTARGVH